MDARVSALFQSTVCFCRATLIVNIHIAIAKETEIQSSPGDNSRSISAISSGLQLKILSWSSKVIHCTRLSVIMALVITYYPFFFSSSCFVFFPPPSAGMPMEVMHSMVWIFALCLPCSCQGSVQQNHCSSAAVRALWAASVLTVEFTAPSQHKDIRLNRPLGASLWQLLSFYFQSGAKIPKQSWKLKICLGREGNRQEWDKSDLPS